ncbi:MAG: RNase adapter RapZ [Bacteroidales bacterium]
MKEIIALFEKYYGYSPIEIKKIATSGSNRKYFRLTLKDTKYVIGVSGSSVKENKAFWAISKHFESKGLPVPSVLSHNEDFSIYLQTSVGDTSIFDMVAKGREDGNYDLIERKILNKAISYLPAFQYAGKDLDFSICYPQASFDKRMISFDLNYFKYCFLKTVHASFNEQLLEDDFDKLSKNLLEFPCDTFMYRDFQARNIMLNHGEPYYIDYQGGRRGPIYYDLVSFIWQARSRFPQDLKDELINTYLEALQKIAPSYFTNNIISKKDNVDTFKNNLKIFVLFRSLQVLGTYGFRGKFEKKAHFLESIPFALKNLGELIHGISTDSISLSKKYPYLIKILNEVIESEAKKAANDENILDNKHAISEEYYIKGTKSHLTIDVYSFSYKNHIPEDTSGHGGGYVFDCRSVSNPGRYPEYKNKYGWDEEVLDFFHQEKNKDVNQWINDIIPIVDRHVKNYIDRDLTHLMFSFGCTGGQHRSVYSAEKIAKYIHEKYNLDVNLEHQKWGVFKNFHKKEL